MLSMYAQGWDDERVLNELPEHKLYTGATVSPDYKKHYRRIIRELYA